jgi:Ala-tRNA(Pro) deacylase
MNIEQFLKSCGIHFEVVSHPVSYRASELAQALHESSKSVAKTVLLHANHGFADVVAVLPADVQVDLAKAGQMLGGAEVALATEEDVSRRCPDCERGVLSPFGSQYGMRTIVDQSLAQDDVIFEGQTHDRAIRMKFQDFQRLENPLIGLFAKPQ